MITSNFLAIMRLTMLMAVFLGPVAGLALYKSEQRPSSGGAGFVLLMSLQRGGAI